jgi:hypothetical protein
LEWGDACFRPQSAQDLLDARREERGVLILWLCDDQADWGRLRALEDFRVNDANLPFDLQAEGKAEFDPDLVRFRPGYDVIRTTTTAQGQPVVPAQRLDPVMRELTMAVEAGQQPSAAEASVKRTLKRLQTLIPPTPAPLPPFEIG